MADTPAVSVITKDLSWIKTHIITAMLAAALVAGTAYSSVTVVENIIAKHDAARDTAEQKIADQTAATQAMLLAQLSQQEADANARELQYQAQLKSLTSQLAVSRAQTQQQVATDNTLDVTSAAERLADQTGFKDGSISIKDGNIQLQLPVARKIVADEDNLAQANSDVNNLSQQLAIQQARDTDALGQLDTANKVIAADKTELIARIDADNAACKVQLDQQAAKARKRSLWLTILGAIGGFAARSAL